MTQFIAMNREHWLTEFAKRVEPLFQQSGLVLPAGSYRVTCGWPCKNALGKKSYRIGECHGVESSLAGIHELFISPRLDNPLDVTGTLCHELLHVSVGVKHGHDSVFATACQRLGLTKGKPTSAGPGARLSATLQRLLKDFGPYPHQSLMPVGKSKEPKPSTSLRVACLCGCQFRVGVKWLEKVGPPTCGCGLPMQVVE